jgi:putrescine transport system substrate-binding protein
MTMTKTDRRTSRWEGSIAFALALLVAGCGHHEVTMNTVAGPGTAAATTSPVAGDEKVLNIYNWADSIDPSVVPAFEKEYGIKVNYDVYDSMQMLETKLLAGRTGYDVVFPSAPFMQRQIQAGVYQKLNKALLPNLKNLDPSVNHIVEVNDPGNQYGVIFLWGTIGFAYNVKQIAAAMPNAPVDSFGMLFDPTVIKHFKDCGVLFIDAPDQVIETLLLYLGKDTNSESMENLKAAEHVLLSIRPYVRFVDTERTIEALANDEICVAFDWNSDVAQVRARIKDAGRVTDVEYVVPKEGGMTWFTMLAIPVDAPHPKNAHLFIDYLLRPDVAAKNSSTLHSASNNVAADRLVDPAIFNDSTMYLSDERKRHLYPYTAHGQSYTRELNRAWTRFKTGQ